MRRITTRIITLVAVFIALKSAGFAQAKFEKRLHFSGNEFYDKGNDVIQTSDGGYLIAGRTVKFHSGGVEAYLVKMNGAGDTLWTRTYGGNGTEEALSVIECKGGGYTFCGYSNSHSAGVVDAYMVHTDKDGKELWSYTYGGEAIDRGFDVQETADGGYIISGETYSWGKGGVNAYLVKTDKDGNELWFKAFGGNNGIEEGNAVLETADGGFIITGATNNFGPGDYDVYLFKVASNGTEEWVCSFGGTGSEEGKNVVQTNDGGYVIAGYTTSLGKGGSDVYVVKTDAIGHVVWEKNYGGANDEEATTIFQTDDEGYVISGFTNSKGNGAKDALLMRLNGEGELMWERTFGDSADDYATSVVQCKDGGYVMSGYSVLVTDEHDNGKNKEIYVIKTDIKGDAVSGE